MRSSYTLSVSATSCCKFELLKQLQSVLRFYRSLEHHPDLLIEATCRLCVCSSGFGQFVAIVLAASRSALDVCSVAVSLVPVILHTAEALRGRAISIYSGPGTWAYEVTGSPQEEIENELGRYYSVGVSKHDGCLRHFLRKTMTDFSLQSTIAHARCYISSVIGDRVRISGPPPMLDQLFVKSPFFAKLTRRSLRIASAHHAPHLMALDTQPLAQLVDHLAILRSVEVLCSSSGQALEYASIADLASKIIEGISQATLDINAMTRAVVERLSLSGPHLASPQTILLGQGPYGTTLAREVTAQGSDSNSPVHVQPSLNMGAFNDNAIAIIGVAGRFPGGDDLEDFWRVIREAKDEHEEVSTSIVVNHFIAV